MAYTYDDFLKAADSSGGLGQFSQSDLTAAQQHPEYGLSLLSLQRDYGKSTTDAQRMLINEAANQLRSSYSVTDGGSFGGGQTATEQSSTGGSSGGSGFNYDVYSDPQYQAYRKEYLRNANRATADALGQYAASTAGRASSYAVNAATQAGDYYATQLADQVPTLYQNAYSKYATERDAETSKQQNNYSNMVSLIAGTGYNATDDELAAAGMNREMADALMQSWAMSNPQQAYFNGVIDAEQYKLITGQEPAKLGASSSSSSTRKADSYSQSTANLQNALLASGYGDNLLTSQIGYGGKRTDAAYKQVVNETDEAKRQAFANAYASQTGANASDVYKQIWG